MPMPKRATSCCAAPICLTASGGTAPVSHPGAVISAGDLRGGVHPPPFQVHGEGALAADDHFSGDRFAVCGGLSAAGGQHLRQRRCVLWSVPCRCRPSARSGATLTPVPCASAICAAAQKPCASISTPMTGGALQGADLFRRRRPVCHRRGTGGAVVGAHGRTGHLGLLRTAGRQLFHHVHPGRRKGVSDRWGRDLNMPPHSP